jgi:riboflavin synthase
MFTGLIECTGTLAAASRRGGLVELTIQAPAIASELALGDSVAVDGICQTVTRQAGHSFRVQATGDTLAKTTLPGWRPGRTVNLERALRAVDRLDGHLVQGHVQGTATVQSLDRRAAGCFLIVVLPPDLAARTGGAVVVEGSIAIDGISLTIAGVADGGPGGLAVRMSLIPHTLAHTTLGGFTAGRAVNIETDLALRRNRNQAAAPVAKPSTGAINAEKLASWGYL